MEATVVQKTEWLDDLTEALWIHILTFLPAKYLPIFRAVCKFFRTIIDDPYFIALHPANHQKTRTLTLESCHSGKYISSTVICEILETVSTNAELSTESSPSSPTNWIEDLEFYDLSQWFVAGSVDGLLLIVIGKYAMLWNPSIKTKRQIHSPSNSISSFSLQRLGLGYDVSCNDYKILAIIDHNFTHLQNRRCFFYELNPESGAWIYSVKTDSWAKAGSIPCRENREMSGSLSFKSGLVWIEGVDTGHSYYQRLVWFDFETKMFHYSPTPYPIKINLSIQNRMVIFDGGSSLGVWGLDSDDHLSMWSMDASAMSWTRLYNIGEGLLRMGAYRNREMMWEYWTKGARPKVSLYNDIEEDVNQLRRPIEYVGDHVESLVLLN